MTSPNMIQSAQDSSPLADTLSASRLSPLQPPAYTREGRKERRDPSITPRKFTRFFTPRSHGNLKPSSARQALYDITAPANNRNGVQSSPVQSLRSISGQENSPVVFTRKLKRRKIIHASEEGTSEKKLGSRDFLNRTEAALNEDEEEEGEEEEDTMYIPSSPCERAFTNAYGGGEEVSYTYKLPIRRLLPVEERGIGGRLMQLRLGSLARSGRRHFAYPIDDYQKETANFYSRPDDVHTCMSLQGPDRSIPFCTTSCNTNSLIAVGDEEGQVRLLESTDGGKPAFNQTFLAFRVHNNAVIDMAFSKDDTFLATASGDQTGRVVDMSTQTTISILANHSASLKQIRFQPGDASNSVLATSSRDGSVQIWDLRCKGSEGSVQHIHQPVEQNQSPGARRWRNGYAISSIYDAHQHHYQTRPLAPSVMAPPGEAHSRTGDVSVTAISFLPPGQSHLLLTASEANGVVKLWDIRSVNNTRRKGPTALSYTKQPETHTTWRHFGISSLNVSSNGDRFYALSKDSTVYAYSTSHLILGHAPELSSNSQERRRPQRETQEGLGPIYGFRHPKLHAASFYVKSALREAKGGKSEMLAVGSSDGCAVLFPTDERYFSQRQPSTGQNALSRQENEGTSFPRLQRSRSGTPRGRVGASDRGDTIPISGRGTPLVRGHDREVGSMAWTNDGNLVTVGDDFLIRCWREGDDARDLRTGGEQGGRRWGCGWADVDAEFDEDDD
ncbi:hypothetical protein BP5796_00575 [Coleophoma crateriformis]|uniref:Uncharacterized protein n=1 Tax=Coleophoma crateriformis TaxID=565419 RepID=A0A3D8T899_9HELO|nr:hypothetical protein BP5796_00575 [Coleophoma crateriformis]